jgi:hypothetical protein
MTPAATLIRAAAGTQGQRSIKLCESVPNMRIKIKNIATRGVS